MDIKVFQKMDHPKLLSIDYGFNHVYVTVWYNKKQRKYTITKGNSKVNENDVMIFTDVNAYIEDNRMQPDCDVLLFSPSEAKQIFKACSALDYKSTAAKG